MADELEVLEKQQLSAQRSLNDLTDQLTLADHLVYKKYLTELQNYGMVELSQQMLDVQDPAQCIQLFQLQKLTLKKGEDMFQKLSTVYYSSMAQGCSLAVMIDVPEENVGANIYLGVREDPLKKNMKSRDLDTSSKALQKVLSSNFPGSETRGIPRQEEKELLDGAFGDTQEAVASVSCVAALRDKSRTEDKAFVQGIERFMDAWTARCTRRCFWQSLSRRKRRRRYAAGTKTSTAVFRPSARAHGPIARTRARL